MAGLVRSDRYSDLSSLMEWKNQRHILLEVPRPNYHVENIDDVYPLMYNPRPYPKHVGQSRHLHVINSLRPGSYGDAKRGHSVAFIGTLSQAKRKEEERDSEIQFTDDDVEDGDEMVPVTPEVDDTFMSDYAHRKSPPEEIVTEADKRRVSQKRHSSMQSSLSVQMEQRRSLSFL